MTKKTFNLYMLVVCAILTNLLLTIEADAQNCNIQLTIHITHIDAHNATQSVIFALQQEQKIVTKSGSSIIQFDALCEGEYNLYAKGLFEGAVDTTFTLSSSQEFTIQVNAVGRKLQTVEIHDDHIERTGNQTVAASTLRQADLDANSGKSLGEILKSASGVNSLQSGPTVSKPIIHGLHSNRVLIVNDGVRLESQQWGSEHAPEIDPFTVSNATVLKGAASLRYGSDAIGGVVLLQPHEISTEPGTELEVKIVGMDNGRMGAISACLDHTFSGKLKGLGMRVQGTIKDAGNLKTARYYLQNTGLEERNVSTNFYYQNKKLIVEMSGALFQSKIGIFGGSHAGNLNDLLLALQQSEPILNAGFSRNIQRGFQDVLHATAKGRICYHLTENSKIELVYGLQKNLRKEYDVGLPFSNNPEVLAMPQANFKISTNTLEGLYKNEMKNNLELNIGASFITQGNVFEGLSYRALIPNFRNYGGGTFVAVSKKVKRLLIETGLRYDFRWLRTYRINYSNLQPFTSDLQFSNFTYTLGGSYKINDFISVNVNLGSAWRAPNVNELYGNGVHQSAASFEIGDSTLKSERAYNSSISFVFSKKKVEFEAGFYANNINNFIYLRPLLTPVTTIAGSFPAFAQTQVNATLSGIDIDFKYQLIEQLKLGSKISIIRGWNRTIKDYLVFTPANRGEIFAILEGKANRRGKKPHVKIAYMLVGRQYNVPPNSDYAATPAAYQLLNVETAASFGKKQPIEVGISVDNLLNVAYRDYLNRFRYFVDDIGRTVMLRITIPFTFKKP
jgi:iron complex outermembrane receptor protein